MIKDVLIKKLNVIPDERGRLGEIFRSDDPDFEQFAQCYFTTNYPGIVKAWHYHKLQNDYVACVKGMIKLAMYDSREDSPTKGEVQEIFLGEHAPKLIKIPKGVYHGWKCTSESESIVVNLPTQLYDYKNPDEYRLPYDTDQIPYDWGVQHG